MIATILISIIFILYLSGYLWYIRSIYVKEIVKSWVLIFSIPLLISILIISSNFLSGFFDENISFFRALWGWFGLIGVLFLISGLRIMQVANRSLSKEKLMYSTKGIFKWMRFPKYSAFFLIYSGAAILLDSFIGVVFIPFLLGLLELIALIEQKKVLSKKYKESYKTYIRKTPSKMFPNPFNYVLIIIIILMFYVGFLNFFM